MAPPCGTDCGTNVKLPSTLLARTNVVLGVSAAAIALTSIAALAAFVILPIEDRSAHDEAGLMVLAAQTWAELPPEARHFFEIELLAEHDLVVTADVRVLPPAPRGSRVVQLLEAKLSQRLGASVELMASDDLLWANVPMGGHLLQVGVSPERQDVQPVYVGIVIVFVGAAIVATASALIVRRDGAAAVRCGAGRGIVPRRRHFRAAAGGGAGGARDAGGQLQRHGQGRERTALQPHHAPGRHLARSAHAAHAHALCAGTAPGRRAAAGGGTS